MNTEQIDRAIDILIELNGIVTCCVDGQHNKEEAYNYLDELEALIDSN